MKPITSGQQEQCVTVIKDAARKGGEDAIAELAKSGVINLDNLQRVLGWKGLAPKIQVFVKEQIATFVENIASIVKLISGVETLTLGPTDGKETIANAGDVFTWGIDGDFKNWGCNVKSAPTKEQAVQVHELIKHGTFEKIFGGMSDDLDSLCLTQPQIIQFVKKHKKWLRTDGYGTFFLFKVGDEFFVAGVDPDSGGGPHASVDRLSDDYVWNAAYRHRFVVPQLALAN